MHQRRRNCTDWQCPLRASLRVKFPRLYSDASQTRQLARLIASLHAGNLTPQIGTICTTPHRNTIIIPKTAPIGAVKFWQTLLAGESAAPTVSFGRVEVELLLSIGWSWRIRDVGRLSRNRVVLVFDPKDGWLVVAWRLIPSISGLGNG